MKVEQVIENANVENGFNYGSCPKCKKRYKTINYSPSRKNGQFSITRFPIGLICVQCKIVKLKEGYTLEQNTITQESQS